MKHILFAATVALAASPFAIPSFVEAQGLRTPAELPPPGYSARQYVDSRGCVFFRAGVDGATTWIPRVNRQREPICGMPPSVAAANTPVVEDISPAAAAPDVVEAPRPAPRALTAPMRTVASIPAQPEPAPIVVAPAPAAAAPVVRTPRVVTAPRPAPVQFAQAAPRVAKDELRRAAAGEVSGNARILPRHLWEQREDRLVDTTPPPGYTHAWDDDRLNPHRAEQTLNGRNQMLLAWTNTTPRRLIDRSTGRDVTAKFPKLYFPHTSMADQRARVSTQGTVAPKAAPPRPVAKPRAVVSTKSAPKRPSVSSSHRFVQVGVFSTHAKAKAAADRIRRQGMPVKYGDFRHKGRSLRAVLIPLSQVSPQRALSAARRAGYVDASLRK